MNQINFASDSGLFPSIYICACVDDVRTNACVCGIYCTRNRKLAQAISTGNNNLVTSYKNYIKLDVTSINCNGIRNTEHTVNNK